MSRFVQRFVRHPLEAVCLVLVLGVFRALPIDIASALGGWLARMIGPRLGVSRVAIANLKRVFPDLGDADVNNILRGLWENLGRTLAEHPHIAKFDPYDGSGRIEIVGKEYCDSLYADDKPGVFFSAHLANWELLPLIATRQGRDVHLAYRAMNNPLVDKLFRRGRDAIQAGLFAKGSKGARVALDVLNKGGHVAMLVDQKMNDGIPVPFMGIEAMTAPAVAQFSLRFDCPVVPVRIERLQGARFRITAYPPLVKPDTGDRQRDIAAMMTDVNKHLSEWIRERPEQWLWLHRRWPNAD